MEWEPADTRWYATLTVRDGVVEPAVRLTPRQCRQLAYYIGEATSFQEAVRMAIGSGIAVLQIDPSLGVGNPDIPPAPDEHNAAWLADLDLTAEVIVRKVTLPEAGVRQLAMLPQAAMALTIQEAVDLTMNAALAARAALPTPD